MLLTQLFETSVEYTAKFWENKLKGLKDRGMTPQIDVQAYDITDKGFKVAGTLWFGGDTECHLSCNAVYLGNDKVKVDYEIYETDVSEMSLFSETYNAPDVKYEMRSTLERIQVWLDDHAFDEREGRTLDKMIDDDDDDSPEAKAVKDKLNKRRKSSKTQKHTFKADAADENDITHD